MTWNRQVRHTVLLLIALGGAGICLWLAVPFLAPLTWALALTILLLPHQKKAESRIGGQGTAAFILVMVALVLAALLVLVAGRQLLTEAASGAARVEDLLRRWQDGELASAFPRLAGILQWIAARLDPADALAQLGQWLTGQSTSLIAGSIGQALAFALTFYFLFYFLRDRDALLEAIAGMLPLAPDESERLLSRISDTVQATIRGTVLVAIVQGSLGGLIFWVLGLPAPVFWGLIMALLAVVPVLGAFVVWIPAALLLAADGQWASAIVLALWGGVVIAGIDNVLYPIFVGTQLRLHPLVVFIGAVGGIVAFGAPGVVLGPLVIVATQCLLESLSRPPDKAGP